MAPNASSDSDSDSEAEYPVANKSIEGTKNVSSDGKSSKSSNKKAPTKQADSSESEEDSNISTKQVGRKKIEFSTRDLLQEQLKKLSNFKKQTANLEKHLAKKKKQQDSSDDESDSGKKNTTLINTSVLSQLPLKTSTPYINAKLKNAANVGSKSANLPKDSNLKGLKKENGQKNSPKLGKIKEEMKSDSDESFSNAVTSTQIFAGQQTRSDESDCSDEETQKKIVKNQKESSPDKKKIASSPDKSNRSSAAKFFQNDEDSDQEMEFNTSKIMKNLSGNKEKLKQMQQKVKNQQSDSESEEEATKTVEICGKNATAFTAMRKSTDFKMRNLNQSAASSDSGSVNRKSTLVVQPKAQQKIPAKSETESEDSSEEDSDAQDMRQKVPKLEKAAKSASTSMNSKRAKLQEAKLLRKPQKSSDESSEDSDSETEQKPRIDPNKQGKSVVGELVKQNSAKALQNNESADDSSDSDRPTKSAVGSKAAESYKEKKRQKKFSEQKTGVLKKISEKQTSKLTPKKVKVSQVQPQSESDDDSDSENQRQKARKTVEEEEESDELSNDSNAKQKIQKAIKRPQESKESSDDSDSGNSKQKAIKRPQESEGASSHSHSANQRQKAAVKVQNSDDSSDDSGTKHKTDLKPTVKSQKSDDESSDDSDLEPAKQSPKSDSDSDSETQQKKQKIAGLKKALKPDSNSQIHNQKLKAAQSKKTAKRSQDSSDNESSDEDITSGDKKLNRGQKLSKSTPMKVEKREELSDSDDSDSPNPHLSKSQKLAPVKPPKDSSDESSDDEGWQKVPQTKTLSKAAEKAMTMKKRSREDVSESSDSEIELPKPQKIQSQKDTLMQFKLSNPDLEVLKPRTSFLLEDLGEENEVWLMQCPRTLDPSAFVSQKLKLEEEVKLKLKVGDKKFECVSCRSDNLTACLVASKAAQSPKLGARLIRPVGTLVIHQVLKGKPVLPPKIPGKSRVKSPDNLKMRHPIFGSDYADKIDLDDAITTKLLEAEIARRKAEKKLLKKMKKSLEAKKEKLEESRELDESNREMIMQLLNLQNPSEDVLVTPKLRKPKLEKTEDEGSSIKPEKRSKLEKSQTDLEFEQLLMSGLFSPGGKKPKLESKNGGRDEEGFENSQTEFSQTFEESPKKKPRKKDKTKGDLSTGNTSLTQQRREKKKNHKNKKNISRNDASITEQTSNLEKSDRNSVGANLEESPKKKLKNKKSLENSLSVQNTSQVTDTSLPKKKNKEGKKRQKSLEESSMSIAFEENPTKKKKIKHESSESFSGVDQSFIVKQERDESTTGSSKKKKKAKMSTEIGNEQTSFNETKKKKSKKNKSADLNVTSGSLINSYINTFDDSVENSAQKKKKKKRKLTEDININNLAGLLKNKKIKTKS